METMIERKYALIRVRAGDYLLPANDGKTLWRLAKYEDGPSHGIEDWPRDREFWGVWRYDAPFNGTLDPDAIEDWNLWESFGGYHDTRKEAIDEALSMT